jgi:hypothetical protein
VGPGVVAVGAAVVVCGVVDGRAAVLADADVVAAEGPTAGVEHATRARQLAPRAASRSTLFIPRR